MAIVPAMWTIWAVLAVIVAGLHFYKSRLERDEDDQLFLDDSFNNVKNEQAAIVARVHKIEPVERIALWLAVAATVWVIVYYIIEFVHQLQ